MLGRLSILAAVIAAVLVISSPAATASAGDRPVASAALSLPRVTIDGSQYWYANAGKVLAYIVRTPSIKLVLKVINQCRGVRAYGFFTASGGGFRGGIVAWLPTDPRGCLGPGPVSGGGPGADALCYEHAHTPSRQDPANVTGRGNPLVNRFWVFIGATTRQTCADLSTQVPGGVWGRTQANIPGLPANSVMLIKCQVLTSQGLYDFLASSLYGPVSTRGFWMNDYYVATGITQKLTTYVPDCYE